MKERGWSPACLPGLPARRRSACEHAGCEARSCRYQSRGATSAQHLQSHSAAPRQTRIRSRSVLCLLGPAALKRTTAQFIVIIRHQRITHKRITHYQRMHHQACGPGSGIRGFDPGIPLPSNLSQTRLDPTRCTKLKRCHSGAARRAAACVAPSSCSNPPNLLSTRAYSGALAAMRA